MKIYTKTGDAGKTSLIGGTRVEKDHYRIEAYGTMDELNSWIGMVMDQNPPADCLKTLEEIQDRLFTLGALAAEDKSKSKMKLPGLEEGDVKLLENEIDRMNESLPELKNFILPFRHVILHDAFAGEPKENWLHLPGMKTSNPWQLFTLTASQTTFSSSHAIFTNKPEFRKGPGIQDLKLRPLLRNIPVFRFF
jgi:hypothetical protein